MSPARTALPLFSPSLRQCLFRSTGDLSQNKNIQCLVFPFLFLFFSRVHRRLCVATQSGRRDSTHHSLFLSSSSPLGSDSSLFNMAAVIHSSQSWTDPSPRSSTQLIQKSSSDSTSLTTIDMKDVSNSTRVPRPSAYPKKRPSPYGVSKSRKQSPLYPPHPVVRKSPRAARAEQQAQRQREAQIMAMRREGIYLEDEYREEIRYYMHEMEVC